jgi:hypothetical protein
MREESEALVFCWGDVVFFGIMSHLYHVVARRALALPDEAISSKLGAFISQEIASQKSLAMTYVTIHII